MFGTKETLDIRIPNLPLRTLVNNGFGNGPFQGLDDLPPEPNPVKNPVLKSPVFKNPVFKTGFSPGAPADRPEFRLGDTHRQVSFAILFSVEILKKHKVL